MRRKILSFVLTMGFLVSFAFGQELLVTGTVTSEVDGTTLPGVSVVIKGTQTGATSNIDGVYSIRVPRGATLVFSYIGMIPKEVVINEAGTVNVAMAPTETMLEEFVVTALGIVREKKSLGYAMQEVSGEELVQTGEANLANTLTGKVSGLEVVRSSTGPAGSSKIVLRGFSSLTGDNQPLIVVDGIPMNNFTGGGNEGYWNRDLDFGNGMSDLNPEDIESISVLKGASAAALYGSRAGNGVILITTKTGQRKLGLGITFSASLGVESLFTHPELQNSFGQGEEGIFDPLSNMSWGPKIEGQMVTDWKGQQVPLTAYDNMSNYFEQGISQNYSLAFSQQYDKASVYTSFTRRDDQSVIPGTGLERTNLLTRAVAKFGPDDRWAIDAKVQYINASAKNRPIMGFNFSNTYYNIYTLPRSIDIRQLDPPVNDVGQMVWFNSRQDINPYWGAQYNLNFDTRDRFLLQGSVKYALTDWMNAEVQAGTDLFTTNYESKLYAGGRHTPAGQYSKSKDTFFEHNFSGMLTANKDNLIDRLGIAGTFGANIMMQESSNIGANSGPLEVPNLFAINNGTSNPTVWEGFSQKRIASVFALVQFNWAGYLFLDATMRNDWSSTLSLENRSYFYPSVNSTLVFSEMLESMDILLPRWFTFGKIRASFAQVGNSLEPYQLYNTYGIGRDPLGNTVANIGNVLFDPNVKSELITSREFGADLRFFQNRLGIDFTWYRQNATNQLINLPMDPLSGFEARKINAGDIQNQGIELMLHGRILQNPAGFNWNTLVNFSRNQNTIVDLYEDIETYFLGGFDHLRIEAVVGGGYGDIFGSAFRRVTDENSPHYGRLLLSASGYPQATTEREFLGNQNPTGLLGLTNSFSYKGLTFGFTIDGRLGGQIFSATHAYLQRLGLSSVTAPNGERQPMVVDGVIANGDGTYSENTTPIGAQQYWWTVAFTGNLGINEANVYDATSIRLRNINLNYNLPRKWFVGMPIQGINAGVAVNNVWLIKSYMNGLDPESVYGTRSNAIGFENSAPPTSRIFLFNLNVSF
jgi:TonB-linked SusC/RagA family outer membrane protein